MMESRLIYAMDRTCRETMLFLDVLGTLPLCSVSHWTLQNVLYSILFLEENTLKNPVKSFKSAFQEL